VREGEARAMLRNSGYYTSVSEANILHKMVLQNELPIYKATYDLLLEIFKFTKEFGKEYKYTVDTISKII
jgi:hypothetical protein